MKQDQTHHVGDDCPGGHCDQIHPCGDGCPCGTGWLFIGGYSGRGGF